MSNTVYIETLGCAKNRVDSEIMLGTLLDNQFRHTQQPEEATVIIVNTCGFLTSAVNESIERVLDLAEYKQTGACKKVIVAGCMSERFKESDFLEEFPEVDGVIGTSDYTKILSCVNHALEEEERRSYFEQKTSYSENNLTVNRALSTRHYAYLKIAEGCSNMCSFCNIPKLRGFFQSRSIEGIKNEFVQLVDSGIKEINLISQDSSSYGYDLSKDSQLYPLVQTLLESSDQDFWLRTFYSYPNRYPVELFRLMKEDPRLVPYVDMPFQHYADPVLKRMNRKITGGEIDRLIEQGLEINPEIAFRTTFIVGFPDETEQDFRQLVDFVERGYFQHIGVFTYSHEDNIASAKYGDTIPEEVKEERRDILMSAQQRISLKKNQSQVGQIQKVLLEGVSQETDLLLQARNKYQGVDVDGVVLINEGNANPGEFHNVEIIEAHPYDLVAKII